MSHINDNLVVARMVVPCQDLFKEAGCGVAEFNVSR